MKKLYALFEYIDERFNMFKMYPNFETYIDQKILALNYAYRGHFIVNRLVDRMIQFAIDNKVDAVYELCTSAKSARICEELGLEKVFVLPYSEYIVDGENPILPEPPHTAVQLFVGRADQPLNWKQMI